MIDVKLEGLSKFTANVERVAKSRRRVAKRVIREIAETEMTEAKRRTPVDTGALRSSGHVEGPTESGTDVSIKLVFGGTAAEYAIYVHENEEAFHKIGQAKFLESVIQGVAPYFARRVAWALASEE